MKKIITVLFALLLLTACGSKGRDLNDIKEAGKLVVAMEGNWQPFTYHDETGALVGFDVEVAKYIADYIGVDVEYVEGEFDGLLMGVAGGRYDMVVNGVDVTEERSKEYDFSKAYAYDKVVVMVKKDNDEIKTIDDLNGKDTANTITSTYAQIGTDHGANVQGVDDLLQTIELLKTGRIDATINAEVVYFDYIKTEPDADVKIACYADEVWDIGIAMQKGSSDLVKVVNEAIDAARNDGTLEKLSLKYFGIDITKK